MPHLQKACWDHTFLSPSKLRNTSSDLTRKWMEKVKGFEQFPGLEPQPSHYLGPEGVSGKLPEVTKLPQASRCSAGAFLHFALPPEEEEALVSHGFGWLWAHGTAPREMTGIG